MSELLHDTHIWIAFSFIFFAIVAYRLGRQSVLHSLDSKIEKIRHDIETAETLRVEAQEFLAQYQRKQREAHAEAERILKTAKIHAEQIAQHAETELNESMKRREAWLAQRLKRMEEDAVKEIQAQAADMAVKATHDILTQAIDEKTHQTLVAETISSLPGKLSASR